MDVTRKQKLDTNSSEKCVSFSSNYKTLYDQVPSKIFYLWSFH